MLPPLRPAPLSAEGLAPTSPSTRNATPAGKARSAHFQDISSPQNGSALRSDQFRPEHSTGRQVTQFWKRVHDTNNHARNAGGSVKFPSNETAVTGLFTNFGHQPSEFVPGVSINTSSPKGVIRTNECQENYNQVRNRIPGPACHALERRFAAGGNVIQ